MMVVIESAGITDVGKKRKDNEDALFLDNDQRLFVVADGMGGHQAGEVASALVVETIRDYMKRFKGAEAVEELADSDITLSKPANRLLASIRLANHGVYQLAQNKKAYKGMGSTVAAALVTEDTLIAANVGDSPIYLVHNGSIEQLSVTHNVISEQTAINPEAARFIGRQYRHMLTRAIGIAPMVRPDICEVQLFAGDAIVIGSDGLSDKVAAEEIMSIIAQQTPETACRKLVDLANSRGGEDNITVIALKIRPAKNRHSGLMGLLKRVWRSFQGISN